MTKLLAILNLQLQKIV